MAEFALPKHSKVVKGIDYPLDTDSTNTRKKASAQVIFVPTGLSS